MADTNIQTLTRQLAVSRASLSLHGRALKEQADLKRRLREKFSRHPLIWAGGALLAGIALTVRRPPGKKRIHVSRNELPPKAAAAGKSALVLAAAKILFDATRPMLLTWIRDRLAFSRPRETRGG